MTHAEIDAMPAGPELDALAGMAVGWGPKERALHFCGFCGRESGKSSIHCGDWVLRHVSVSRPISTDHAAALDALAAVYTGTLTHDAHGWHVKIGDNKTCREYWASGDTAPLAIARALAKLLNQPPTENQK